MTTRLNTTLALFTVALFGCADPEPEPVTTTVRTIQTTTTTTQVISLKIGMKGSEAISQAGIPCSPEVLKSIDAGNNVTLKYQGRSYVFSQGVLQAVE